MNFEINYEILEKNSKLKPDDGWGHQCWYINEILNQIKLIKTGRYYKLDQMNTMKAQVMKIYSKL